MQRFARLLLIALAVVVSGVSLATAAPVAPVAPTHASIALAVDPFLNSDATTAVPMLPRCPCTIISSCGFQQIGFDCAQPAHCCSCRGTDPATRICAGVPS